MSQNSTRNRHWGLWFTLPLYPYSSRPTFRHEAVADTIWTFEQPHGLLYAIVTIRMSVVKLAAGGLLVYAPIAPTRECIRLVREIEARHGEVKYIIHPTSSGLEHKVFVGPFARKFPRARVFVAPHQWSFPLNLPLSWLGFPPYRTQVLPADCSDTPLAEDFDYAILDIPLNQGAFTEVALFHGQSRTLLLTDTVIKIPESPPEILEENPYPLLFHARESAGEPIEDSRTNRLKGWQRICLFALYFRPSALETIGSSQLWQEALQAPDRSARAYFGFFPFRWRANWQQSFQALSQRDSPLVAPILAILIFPQAPEKVLNWANRVASWSWEQIIPCHFQAPIKTTPSQFREAFSFLAPNQPSQKSSYPSGNEQWYREDSRFIRELEAKLIELGIAKPPKKLIPDS